MGMFEGLRKRREASRAKREAATFAARHASWQAEMDKIDEFIDVVRECIAGRPEKYFPGTDDYGFILKPGEIPLGVLMEVAYLENVRSPARHSGGYGGVSFPLFGRVRLNTGRIGGTTTPGTEETKVTDTGTALVTNERVMFMGPKRTHEWPFAKMIGMSHEAAGYTVFASKGRGKPTGIGYGESVATDVQFRLELGSAMALGTLPRYEAELVAEKNQLEGERPLPPPPV